MSTIIRSLGTTRILGNTLLEWKGHSQDHGKGGLGLRGVAFMTVFVVLTVFAVLESALPSVCFSYTKCSTMRLPWRFWRFWRFRRSWRLPPLNSTPLFRDPDILLICLLWLGSRLSGGATGHAQLDLPHLDPTPCQPLPWTWFGPDVDPIRTWNPPFSVRSASKSGPNQVWGRGSEGVGSRGVDPAGNAL